MTVMAKIGDLEVNTLHIANAAITGAAHAAITSGSTVGVSVVVPNTSGLPVQLYFRRSCTYIGTHSNDQGACDVSVTRGGTGGVSLYEKSVSFGGHTSGVQGFDGQILDDPGVGTWTYWFSMGTAEYDGNAGPPGPSVSRSASGFLSALWYKV